MDQNALVESKIDDGQKLIERLVQTGFDVAAAFWVQTSEDGQWFLYVGSRFVDEKGPAAAYRVVYDRLDEIPEPSVTASEIKVVGAANPIAKDVVELLRQFPGRTPIRSRRPRLGEMAIDEVYVYPPPPLPPVFKVEKRRLKKEVKQLGRPEDFLLNEEDRAAIAQLTAQGISRDEAEAWVRKKRGGLQPRPPIPAGAIVNAWVAAHWGNTPEDDPDPLLMVESEDRARGLVLMTDTEPVPG